MKELTLFYFDECPHCRRAFKWQEELFEEYPEFRDVPLKLVNEIKEADYADTFDYYYVPTYYLDGVKLHEGVTSKALIEDAFRKALE